MVDTVAHFLFTPGIWQGAGTIVFSYAVRPVHFETRWGVEALGNGRYKVLQVNTSLGGDVVVKNTFDITMLDHGTFTITLHHETLGSMVGSGIYDDEILMWKLPIGTEKYVKKPNTGYSFTARYDSGDGFYTTISGDIRSVLYDDNNVGDEKCSEGLC